MTQNLGVPRRHNVAQQDATDVIANVTRRSFLHQGAVLSASVLGVSLAGTFMTGCQSPNDPTAHTTIDLGSETGILNYAYALLQLEVDFYARVTLSLYAGISTSESSSLTQFLNATTAARNDLRTNQIPHGRITEGLLFRTGRLVDFASRTSVLTHAQTIEETCADAMQALSTMATTPDTQTLLNTLTSQAQTRASTIDGWLGASYVPATIDLTAAMTALAPFYLTVLTILDA